MSRAFEWSVADPHAPVNDLISDFLSRDGARIKENLFLAWCYYPLNVDVIRNIVLALCPTQRKFSGIIDWITTYLENPCQFKKNPLIFGDTDKYSMNSILLLSIGDKIKSLVTREYNSKYESIHIDVSDSDEFMKYNTFSAEKYLELVCTCVRPELEDPGIRGTTLDEIVPNPNPNPNPNPTLESNKRLQVSSPTIFHIRRCSELVFGIIIPDVRKIKRAWIASVYNYISMEFDLMNPVMLTKGGGMYAIPGMKAIPLIALQWTKLELNVDGDAGGISIVYGFLETPQLRRKLAKASYDYVVDGKKIRIDGGIINVVE